MRRRLLERGRRLGTVWTVLLAGCVPASVGCLLGGCSLFYDPALEGPLNVRESRLPPAALAARLEEADRLFREPRDVGRVTRSLMLSLEAVSSANGYAALWRGSRACYWLAGHHPDEGKRVEFAGRGVELGRAASARAPGEPSSHYFHALNLGLLSRLEGRGVRRVEVMAALARRVIELDERYAYAGGHRFLGLLILHTMDNPLVAVGDIDEALEHLRRACELAPNYGGNQLALAEVLIADEEFTEARRRLELVLASTAPEGERDEHRAWLTAARALLKQIPAEAARG